MARVYGGEHEFAIEFTLNWNTYSRLLHPMNDERWKWEVETWKNTFRWMMASTDGKRKKIKMKTHSMAKES